MKRITALGAALILAFAISGCSSVTAPEDHTIGSNNHTIGSNNHTIGSNNHTIGSNNHTMGSNN